MSWGTRAQHEHDWLWEPAALPWNLPEFPDLDEVPDLRMGPYQRLTASRQEGLAGSVIQHLVK